MPKVITPAFPPRRPARYLLIAVGILALLYLHRNLSPTLNAPVEQVQPVPHLPHRPPSPDPALTAPGQEFIVDGKPADINGPKSEEPPAADADTDTDTDESTPDAPDAEKSQKPQAWTKDPFYDGFDDGFSDGPSDSLDETLTSSGSSSDSSSSNSGSSDSSSSDSSSPKSSSPKSPSKSSSHSSQEPPPGPKDSHPIDRLVYDAQHTFAEIISRQSNTLEDAAQAYRKRRGRHPPPGFDAWFKFAQSRGAIIVEDFFDQIYHDLEPFWGLPPAVLRKESWDFEMTIHIRNGKATTSSDWFWTVIWLDLIQSIEHLLPDMDISLNPMDEPRIIVPWEEMEKYMSDAKKTVQLPKAKTVRRQFQQLPEPGYGDLEIETRKKDFETAAPFWSLVRSGCPPDSLARTTPIQRSFANPPHISIENAKPHMYEGYVRNYTLSTEVCHQPDLQGLEGILIEPLSVSTTKVLFPMFGGSKLHVNNEILLPAPMYWSEEERFTGGNTHGVPWQSKFNKVIWRGVATGGKNRPSNWRGFQRHRFVSMNNATEIMLAETDAHEPENFAMPDGKTYNLSALEADQLSEWVDRWADAGFIDLNCEPPEEGGTCSYTSPHFDVFPGMHMATQFRSKYLPDLDGNSFSGRYLGFLRSTSLPIKATMFREWHDSRLLAWKHFVPMDNRFSDYYGIMDYFIGFDGKGGHDHVAEQIATDGKEWAEKVLRKEDMQIYTLRLLLEYARVLDDDRVNLGWVDDVLRNPALERTWASWW